MPTTLAELAQLVGGQLQGDGATPITGAATLSTASLGDITLADHADRASELTRSSASAVITPRDLPHPGKPAILVDNVHGAFTLAVKHFHPSRSATRIGVSDRAVVSPSARLADDVDVHPMATIGDDVVIGRRSTVHPGVQIAAGCVIGNDVTLFPNVVLYENTRLGDRVIVHGGAVLGAHGFGYRLEEGRHVLSSQLGHVEVGDDVEIGAGTTVDRGTYGATVIGEGTKIDNLVMVAHNCRLGRHNLICSQVGIAGSATTGDYVVMAGQAGVRDHVHVGAGAVVYSKSGVSSDVPDGVHMLGQPATPIRKQKVQMAAVSKLPEMRRQFRALQRQLKESSALIDAAELQSSGASPGESAPRDCAA